MSAREIELTSHESELGAWEMIQAPPRSNLQSSAYGYSGWNSRTPGLTVRRHLPGLVVPLIAMFEPGFEVNADVDDPGVTMVNDAFVAGLHDSYAVTRSPGREGGIQIDLSPQAARQVFGVPMREITSRAFEAEEVIGPAVRRLAGQLRDLATWEERFDAVDAFLYRRLADAAPPDPRVSWAYRRIVQSGGSAAIAPLAEALGWSHRRLVDGFRDEIGLPPKTLARVVRFNRALRFAERNPTANWAEVASATGYYDQPHLVREFVALSGSSPTDLAARTLPPGGGVQG